MKGGVAYTAGLVNIINSAIILAGNDSLSIGARTGIGIGLVFIWTTMNVLRIDRQGWINNFALIFQILLTVSIIIVLLVMAPQLATARNVFTSTYNGTGFPFPYVCVIGIMPALFSLTGYEGNILEFELSILSTSLPASAHMAEETQNAELAGRQPSKEMII